MEILNLHKKWPSYAGRAISIILLDKAVLDLVVHSYILMLVDLGVCWVC